MNNQYYVIWETPASERVRIPAEADDTFKQRRLHNALRQELQTAIEQENFERAAEIRDEMQQKGA